MANERHPSPAEETRRLYDEAETRTAQAFEQLVARDSFGELLARVTENVVALTKISTDVFDLILRNLRLAGRQDITRLSRQLARTEDKLELLLQEVERLQAQQPSGDGRVQHEDANGASGREQVTSGDGS
ncbi:MAG: hypothetical protein JO153_07965 [Solirubrobacterales bacterium]|nr:hypothetical protein [Solirubrobacterales bacterium]MBV9916425.1 hypothetical protein [Solirubrobacterales bacterium]